MVQSSPCSLLLLNGEGTVEPGRRKVGLRWPGVEPGSTAWKAAMLTTIPPTLLHALLPPAPPAQSLASLLLLYVPLLPASCSARSPTALLPAPLLHRLSRLLLPAPCTHTHDLNLLAPGCASLPVSCWLRKLQLLAAGNGHAPHLRSHVGQLRTCYAGACAFAGTYLWWFKHRQTPTQLLTTFPTRRAMQSTENTMRNLMAQDKHTDMA